VGGGLILKKQGIVLTQPTKGKIKAFSTTCTHAGCAVNDVADGSIVCPCHGSKFAIADGAPTDGPAGSPLEAVKVRVKAKKVYLA
jgi:Rieske Fe-S protein